MRMKWNKESLRSRLRAVLRPKKNVFSFKNRILLLLALPLLVGLLTGVLLCRNWSPETGNGIEQLVNAFVSRRNNPSFWTEFAYSFESVFLFFGLIYLCGVSLLGGILIPVVLLLRGLGLGAVMGCLYAGYGSGGVLYSIFLLLPFFCGTSLVLLVMAREGISFSGKLFRTLRGEENILLRKQFGRYCIRSGMIVMMLCVASLADSAWNLLFSGVFHIV